MRKVVLSLVLGGGMVTLTVLIAALLALCFLNPYLNYDYGPGDERYLGIFESSMTCILAVGLHRIQLPFPLLKVLALFVAALSLFAIGYLLRVLFRLHRHAEGISAPRGHGVTNTPS